MIFVAGYPKHIGGANTELWHTLKLWRSRGIEVSVIPTWPADHPTPDPWRKRLEAIGVPVILTEPDDLHRVLGLPDSTVVSFCNTRFLEHASKFQGLGCPIVWLPCMTWLFPQERLGYKDRPIFDWYVFQSEYQRDQVEPQLAKFGYTPDRGAVIHGAFDRREFVAEPRTHDPGSRFYVGRLSRMGIDKFPADLFAQYSRIPYPTSARIMGWSEEVEEKLGAPPKWADCLPESTETPQRFMESIHCMIPGFGCCRENWPRVGLEAMAAGVPIIAENAGGWREMLPASQLAASVDEQAYLAATMAYDRQYRMGVIESQYWQLGIIASEQMLGDQWEAVFQELSC